MTDREAKNAYMRAYMRLWRKTAKGKACRQRERNTPNPATRTVWEKSNRTVLNYQLKVRRITGEWIPIARARALLEDYHGRPNRNQAANLHDAGRPTAIGGQGLSG